MICQAKLSRLLLVWGLIGLMLLNGTVRAACLCTDGQSKAFCGKLFERTVFGPQAAHQSADEECCCENCQRQTNTSEMSELAAQGVENRKCQPVHSVMDYQVPEIKDLSALIHAQTLAIDQPRLQVEATSASVLDLLRERGGRSLRCAQHITVLLI